MAFYSIASRSLINGSFVIYGNNLSRFLHLARKFCTWELERPFCILVKEFALELRDRLNILFSLSCAFFSWNSVVWQPISAMAWNLFYIYEWNIENACSSSACTRYTLPIRIVRDFEVAGEFGCLCVCLPSTGDSFSNLIFPVAVQGFAQTNRRGSPAAVNKLSQASKSSFVKSFQNFFLI